MGIKIAALARCKFSGKGQVWGGKIIQHKVLGKGFSRIFLHSLRKYSLTLSNEQTIRFMMEDIYIVNWEFASSTHKWDDGDDDGANVTIIRVIPPS